MTEPDWIAWAREVQAIGQVGLTFAENPYDRERYEALQALAARVMASAGDADLSRVAGLFAAQQGYATPDRKSTRLNSSHVLRSRMPSSA